MNVTKINVNTVKCEKLFNKLARFSVRPFLKVLLLPLVLLNISVLSQTPYSSSAALLQTPGTAASGYGLSEFEQVNLSNGKLSVKFDLAKLIGRGGTGYNISVSRSTAGSWSFETLNVNGAIIPKADWSWVWLNAYGLEEESSRLRYSPGKLAMVFGGERDSNNCVDGTYTRFSLQATYGPSMDFIDEAYEGQISPLISCNQQPTLNRGREFVTKDGSGAKFISDVDVYDSPVATTGDYSLTTGNGVVLLRDGTKYRIDNGLIKYILDKNGNKTSFEYESYYGRIVSVTDSNNRQINFEYNINHAQYGLSDKISYKGNGGAERAIYVSRKNISNALMPGDTLANLDTLFPNAFGNTNYTLDAPVLSEIWLPNGKCYKLYYNSYGDIVRVELPTGGAVQYSSSGANGSDGYLSGANIAYRRLNTRRLYSSNNTLIGKTEFGYTESGSSYSDNSTSSTTISQYAQDQQTLLSKTRHYFHGVPNYGYLAALPGIFGLGDWRYGREFQTDSFAANGTTVLQTRTYKWEQRAPISWWTPNPNFPNWSPPNDPRITEVKTILADTNQISLKKYSYDNYNNLTDVFDYDWGNGAVGNFIRRSHIKYKTSTSYINPLAGIYLPSLPEEQWVSSDLNGSALVSLTKYEHDNYTTTTNSEGTVISDSLKNRTDASGHESAYNTGYLTRGNVTKICSYENAVNQTNEVSAYYLYDILGNAVKVIDARGKSTIYNFEDNFGSPDTESRTNTSPAQLNLLKTYAFLTKITNSVGYETFTQYDYFNGSVVNTEDINGNVDAIFYNDSLDRPKQRISANNRSQFRRQTTFNYYDDYGKVTITSDSKNFDDNLIKAEYFYDGFGRTIESRQYETSSNYIVSFQEYDEIGRPYKSSTPHRPYLSEQPQWTTTKFDSLGRTVEIKSTDNAVLGRSYSGSTITVTDQNLRKRSGTFDAMGRLTKATEDPNGLNYETTYQYDVLGRLRKTTQIEGQITQNRYFMYNDLGRLIRAKQTEQIANTSLSITDPVTGNSQWSVSYSYDKNGNLTSTTDANNRIVTASYDDVNRQIFRNYSDPATPDVTYTFDDPNVANSKGQLTAVSSTDSSTLYTAFDLLGRIKGSRQETGGQIYNFPDYTYDLSGTLISQTYPSLRVVKTETDNLGRLSRIASQVTNGFERTYLSDISYTSFGAVRQSKFGNGRWESAQFDPKRLQLTQIGLGASAGDTNLLKLEYAYGTTNNNGSLREQKISMQGMSNQLVQSYTYDTLNRLESATETANSQVSWKQTFTYDRFGNRRFNAGNTTTLPANNAVYNPNIDKATNKFLVAEGYNYDNEGNLTSNPENQLFTYDSENRQTQVQNTATQVTANYFYDGNGKRVKKVVGTQETLFVYDAFGKLVAEYTTNQTITTEGTKYLTTDALGSPRAITNVLGQIASRHDYMAFGEEIPVGVGGRTSPQGYPVSGDGIRQQFTGYERDSAAESGLDYAQARYFSSKHGRFTSVDPAIASVNIKNPQTLNRYSYALNSPYKFVDPLGLAACSSIADSVISSFSGDACNPAAPLYETQGISQPAGTGGMSVETSTTFHEGSVGEGEPAVQYPSWYVWESELKIRSCPRCGPWDVKGRIGFVKKIVAYYPDEVNQMLYDFAVLEAQTAEADEEAYANWYTGSDAAIEISWPPSISWGSPPPRTLYKHDKDIEKRIISAIDKAASEGKYNQKQTTLLKQHVRAIINKTANDARRTGMARFHYKNPAVTQHSTDYYWIRRPRNDERPVP